MKHVSYKRTKVQSKTSARSSAYLWWRRQQDVRDDADGGLEFGRL